jgi:hypothetical protein
MQLLRIYLLRSRGALLILRQVAATGGTAGGRAWLCQTFDILVSKPFVLTFHSEKNEYFDISMIKFN